MFTDLSSCNFTLLIGNTIHCEPDWSWNSKSNRWSGYHLWYVLNGEASITIKNITSHVYPGDVYLFNLSDNHVCTHNPSNPLSVLTLYFIDQQATEIITSQKISTIDRVFMKNLFEQTITHFNQSDSKRSLFWLRSLLSYCNDHYIQSLPSQIDKIITMINLHPFAHYTLDSLANKSGYSKNHFIRLFKKQTTFSPLLYCIRVKIEKTKHLLLYSNYSITKISETAGFSDVSFFSKQFKQITGLSPLSYKDKSSTQPD